MADPVGLTSKFLVDPYMDWAKGSGFPSMRTSVSTSWRSKPPLGPLRARGCFAHTHGRGDFMANYVVEIPAGGKTAPVKHLYEDFFYVLVGPRLDHSLAAERREADVRMGPEGAVRDPAELPVSDLQRLGAGDGAAVLHQRRAADAQPLSQRDFVFNNPYQFPERFGKPNEFDGEGEHVPVDRGDGSPRSTSGKRTSSPT